MPSVTIRTLIEAADRQPNVNDSGPWSLGVLVGGPVLALTIIGVVVVGVILLRYDRRLSSNDYDKGVAKWCGIGTLALAVGLVIGCIWGYYPYGAEYHQYRETSGTVQKIDHRLIGSGDSMEDKFVVRFEGSSQQYGCDDTRCAQVEAGDDLALSCKRAWQYTGTDGYDCRFVSTEAAR